MVTRLGNGGKTAQQSREESAASARPTFQRPSFWVREGVEFFWTPGALTAAMS